MTQLSHDSFRASGVNSIFISTLTSESDLDSYMNKTFLADFGFAIDPPSGPEYNVRPDSQTPIEDLLKEFSESEKFATQVARELRRDGWIRAPAAVVFYNLAYDPKRYAKFNNFGALKFVGSIDLASKVWTPWHQLTN
jgi:hypothetical protein